MVGEYTHPTDQFTSTIKTAVLFSFQLSAFSVFPRGSMFAIQHMQRTGRSQRHLFQAFCPAFKRGVF
jgi:hypothetical protein